MDQPKTQTNEEDMAVEAFKAQLQFTATQINHQLSDHFHFTDDCGDDLFAVLDLSRDLQFAAMDGTQALLAKFDDLAKPTGDPQGEPGELLIDFNYADAAPEVLDFCRHLNETRG